MVGVQRAERTCRGRTYVCEELVVQEAILEVGAVADGEGRVRVHVRQPHLVFIPGVGRCLGPGPAAGLRARAAGLHGHTGTSSGCC